MTQVRQILLCTVGGSHAPILKAIESSSPDFVCFFCTGRDPATGKAGSIGQVTGKGRVIRASPNDKAPTLPNIPSQAGLAAARFDVREVPADDLDRCFSEMRRAVGELAERFPRARFVADYTGGTKTMTAALVYAAVEADGIDLQLITGARAGLVGVRPTTEDAVAVSGARLRLDRALAPCLDAWTRFGYREAAAGLDKIAVQAGSPDMPRLQVARALSHGLALWDDFDHAGAWERIEPFAARFSQDYPKLLTHLRLLTHGRDTRNEPLRIHDLWLNAERRAAQGRYDDAVARVYRLIEWTAQWQLRSEHGIDTGDLPVEWLPAGASVPPDRNGKYRVGLRHAWQVVRERMKGPARDFICRHENELRHRLEVRNQSILAHGSRPVSKADWEEFRTLMKNRFLPMFRALADEAGLADLPGQLPTHPPEFVRRAF